MEISLAQSVPASVATPAPQPQNTFQNQDQFTALIDRVENAAGTYSAAEQLDAYTSLHTLAVSGGLLGMGDANQALYNHAISTSAIAQKVTQVGQAYTLAMAAGAQRGGASGARQAALTFFDSQGPFAQSVLFRGHINAADMTGSTPYADVAGWRASMLAGIKLDQYVETASAKGDPYVQAKNDPTLAAALKLSESSDQNTIWAQQIVDLLGGRDPIHDTVDLSDAARQLLGDEPLVPKAQTAPYQPGYLASKTV